MWEIFWGVKYQYHANIRMLATEFHTEINEM